VTLRSVFNLLNEGAQDSVQDIQDFVNNQIAHYKKVREIKIVDSIPVSGAGKILKRELRELDQKDN